MEIEDNTGECIDAMKQAVLRALEIIGGMAETYAKGLTPVDTGALRNSITHVVDENKKQVTVGSNMEYAPYVELGTGRLYEPPEEWIEYQAQKGRGLDKWYYKGRDGKWHVGFPRKGAKMIQRAVKEHLDEYKNIIERANSVWRKGRRHTVFINNISARSNAPKNGRRLENADKGYAEGHGADRGTGQCDH